MPPAIRYSHTPSVNSLFTYTIRLGECIFICATGTQWASGAVRIERFQWWKTECARLVYIWNVSTLILVVMQTIYSICIQTERGYLCEPLILSAQIVQNFECVHIFVRLNSCLLDTLNINVCKRMLASHSLFCVVITAHLPSEKLLEVTIFSLNLDVNTYYHRLLNAFVQACCCMDLKGRLDRHVDEVFQHYCYDLT